ncbi:hypothetical protein [uncultured Azohydromonas sp.]|uniref:hypothetical protein n=1 Tax=uncultured Azohydromonas sp. TaxID=487342 RepID=UPI002616D2F4|nr:hypothetical protein [uncultured Azohydromonas sp.]
MNTRPFFNLAFLRPLALLFLLALLQGCSVLQGGKLWAPQAFGFERIAPDLYVEAGADAATRARLLEDRSQAEAAVRAAFGSVLSRPGVHACVTEHCYESFGGRGSTAKVYGDRILLSPRGLDRHFLAHEWTHAEIHKRLALHAWWSLPRWFDEGLAVAVSEAPAHSQAHWQQLLAAGIRVPTPRELRAISSLWRWEAAVHKYGDGGNAQRRARGEPELQPLYTAAGQEVRPWLKAHGTPGLLALIAGLNAGEPFEALYDATAAP